MNILLYLGIGLLVGTASGTLGIGGGVLLVPALIWLCGFDPGRAAGTSLAVLMIPVCFPAAWKAFGQGRVDLEAAFWIAAAFAVGGYAGASAVPYISEQSLRLALGILLVLVGVQFLAQSNHLLLGAAVGTVAWLVWLPGACRQDLALHPAGPAGTDYTI